MKFGKLAPREDSRTLRFGALLAPDLQPPPEHFNLLPRAEKGAGQSNPTQLFPMLGNDRVGDCCAEGTEVAALNAHAAYRARYSGPMVTIVTEFGRRLTVTPNHGILTPRGFTLARLLKQGDYVISGDFAKGLRAGALGVDLDQPPALIEQVFAAQDRIGAPVVRRRSLVSLPAYFHGDGRFMHGDVDVVYPNGLLECEPDPSLGEPDSHEEVGAARELEGAFAGAGASLQADSLGGLAAFGDVGRFRHGGSLAGRQSGMSEGDGLAGGSLRTPSLLNLPLDIAPVNPVCNRERLNVLPGYIAAGNLRSVHRRVSGSLGADEPDPHLLGPISGLHASIGHPSEEGAPTDPQLARNLFRRFPGLITADRVMEVRNSDYSGHVYDLSTEQRWYSSNGIISHNCTIAAAAHAETVWNAFCGKRRKPSKRAVLNEYYALTGGDDTGLVMLDVCNHWRKHGVTGEKILAFAGVDRRRHDLIKQSIYLFGGLYLGFNVTDQTLQQFNDREMWTPGRDNGEGHCVWAYAYSPDWLAVLTWGSTIRASWQWFDSQATESFAIFPGEAALAAFEPGLDMAALRAALDTVTA